MKCPDDQRWLEQAHAYTERHYPGQWDEIWEAALQQSERGGPVEQRVDQQMKSREE